MVYKAWFQCIGGCDVKYSLFDVVYKCEKCGDLLEVVHDTEALKDRSPASWMKLFDSRYRAGQWPYGSGVWGKKEIVVPDIDNENIVSMYEGGTNLFWADRLGKEIGVEDLWVKLCGNSHTGSFKDLGMTVLVSVVKEMISRGSRIPAVACASTGDTSAALAAYAAAAKIQAIVFLPHKKISLAQLIQPVSNGALVLSLDTDFDGCMKMVREITSKHNIYLANSMNSLRVEGQKTISLEIVQQFDWEVPDVVVIPGGNLGNVSALGKGFLIMEKLGMITRRPRIVVAQAQKANPLYLSYQKDFKEFEPVQARKTAANAIQIGNPVSVNKAIRILREFNGIVERASEAELSDASARADRTGMFTCPHTGVALASLKKLIDRGEISKDQKVVVISTAHGLKFTEFKVGYHERTLPECDYTYANKPIELPNKREAVEEAIFRHLDGNI